MHQWRWVAARSTGTSHVQTGSSCEDAVLVREVEHEDGNVLVAAVSDGAGSAGRGGVGSAIATRMFVARARSHVQEYGPILPSDEQIWEWIDHARDSIAARAGSEGLTPREFAATLICAFLTPAETLIIHIGDGAAVLDFDEGWEVPLWPASGEFASSTFFVTDDPEPKLVTTRLEKPVRRAALFTDGLERLALRFADQCAHEPFFDGMFTLVDGGDGLGRDRAASAKLRRFLDSPAVNERTDDDKTLVLAGRL